MQRNSNIPESAQDRLKLALCILSEHFDDVLVAVNHRETSNIHVVSPTPYSALGMLPTIQGKLREAVGRNELAQSVREEIDDYGLLFDEEDNSEEEPE
tara:strand:+ start:480 stop:773 length:294 start_codon:yes stop_codon:yes gene_type:complete